MEPGRYMDTLGVEYRAPDRIGYTSVPVLAFLTGCPWDALALAYVHALRPSDVRVPVPRYPVPDNAVGWRVTVSIDDRGIIQKIQQEVDVGLGTAWANGWRLDLDLGRRLGLHSPPVPTIGDLIARKHPDLERYQGGIGAPYQPPSAIGYTSMPVLPFLVGLPWDALALAYAHSVRPSSIRVTTGEEKMNARPWRLTVTVDDCGLIEHISQEVEVGIGFGNWSHGASLSHDLHQRIGPDLE